MAKFASSATTSRLRSGSGSGEWVPPPNGGSQLRWQTSFGLAGSPTSTMASPPSRHAAIGEIAGDQPVMQRVAPAFRPGRRLAAAGPHARQPELADHFRLGRLLHVDDDQDMVGKFRQMHRDIGVALADIPDAMRPQAAERQEGDLARRFRLRQIVDAQPAGELLTFERVARGAGEIGLLAHLHGPHARAIDRQQQVAVGLDMVRAGIRRAGQEIDRLRILRDRARR